MDLFELLEESGYTPKRKAACHGGEYSSPCPFCKDGTDRFLIWPKRSNKDGSFQGGRFACRKCGKYGDAITFIRELYGLSYKDACERLKLEPKIRHIPLTVSKPNLPVVNDPPFLWQEKAGAFVDWCHEQLMKNPKAQALLLKRGFTAESIKLFRLGFNPKNLYRERNDWGLDLEQEEDKSKKIWLPSGIVIPTFSQDGRAIRLKVRRNDADIRRDVEAGKSERKYVEVSGLKKCYSIYGNTSLLCAFILESELDGLLIQQFAGDIVYCVALGGTMKPLDFHTDSLLKNTPHILFCPDFDEAGAHAWKRWKKIYSHIHRILTPDGKAPGDALIAGIDLREWILDELKQNKHA